MMQSLLAWFLHSAATDPEQARRGRLLNWFLLVFGVLSLINVGAALVLGLPETAVSIFSLTALLIGIYVLNRRGAVTQAAAGLVALLFVLVTVVALLPEGGLVSAGQGITLLILPVALAGVTLTWRWVLLTLFVALGDGVWLYEAAVPQLAAYRQEAHADLVLTEVQGAILILGIALIAALASYQTQLYVADLKRRNADLAAANRDLAGQRAREQALSAQIGDLADRLAAVSAGQVSQVATQARSITHVASTVAELHATADQIAALAEQVRQAADIALHAVQRAQELVQQSRDAVRRNRRQVEQVAVQMQSIADLTDHIAAFVNGIRDLAAETHLLALNAAIEAAGAGEAGRRFAVVVDEVQSLSTRANEIVDQIRVLIADMEHTGRGTLAAVRGSITIATEVEGLSDEVRTAQAQVVEVVARTGDLAHRISVATAQQTATTDQMARTMQEIASATSATSRDTGALEQAVRELQQAATLLNSALDAAQSLTG